MTIIVLDIGNSNIVIATVKDDVLHVLMDPQGKGQISSVVSFSDHERHFGSLGAPFLSINPEATISGIKRLIGRSFRDEDLQDDIKVLPFRTIEGPRGGEILIKVDYLDAEWIFSPVEILAMLLKHAKHICETSIDEEVNRCVISILAYFTNLQRRLYLDAARIAGLTRVALVHDGTAIALGYGLRNSSLAANVLFVDVGQSDSQVTVAEFQSGQVNILSHTFDQSLGGKDFDALMYNHFAEEIMRDYKLNVEMSASGSIRLRASCEKLKINLGAKTEGGFIVKHLIKNQDIRCFVRRDRFDELTSQLLKRITSLCSKALEESGLSIDRITAIELVGSGSRIPAIAEAINRVLKKKPGRTLNASESVARGCALYGYA